MLEAGCVDAQFYIFCEVLAVGVGVMGWNFLPGKFLSYLAVVKYIGGILKSACNQYLAGTVSSVFKVTVGCTPGGLGNASGRLTGSCMGSSVRRAHSIGRCNIRGRCVAGSG